MGTICIILITRRNWFHSSSTLCENLPSHYFNLSTASGREECYGAVKKCNRYNTPTDILYIQPQSLFSISVYLYLLSDFSPFTTILVLIHLLLHNRKRFSVLVGLKVLGLLHFLTS